MGNLGRPRIFTEQQRQERVCETKRRHSSATASAKTELARRYPEEFRDLQRHFLLIVNAARGPLPHEDVVEAHYAERPAKIRKQDLRRARAALAAMPDMQEAVERIDSQIADM